MSEKRPQKFLHPCETQIFVSLLAIPLPDNLGGTKGKEREGDEPRMECDEQGQVTDKEHHRKKEY